MAWHLGALFHGSDCSQVPLVSCTSKSLCRCPPGLESKVWFRYWACNRKWKRAFLKWGLEGCHTVLRCWGHHVESTKSWFLCRSFPLWLALELLKCTFGGFWCLLLGTLQSIFRDPTSCSIHNSPYRPKKCWATRNMSSLVASVSRWFCILRTSQH